MSINNFCIFAHAHFHLFQFCSTHVQALSKLLHDLRYEGGKGERKGGKRRGEKREKKEYHN